MSDEQWENEEVEATKPADVVISTRFPAEVAERISAEARRRGMRTSQFVRVAFESALEGGGASSGSIFVSMADGYVRG